jgi:hypothetical protein
MELYSGKIPNWLSPEDVKGFSKQIRKELISATEFEGKEGISGRMSLNIFSEFMARYQQCDGFIHMGQVSEFFTTNEQYKGMIPDGFIDSMNKLYDFDILQRVKEAIYFYNEDQVTRDIINYLYAINYESGDEVKCPYTGDVIEVTNEYFKNFEAFFIGSTSSESERNQFRKDIHHEYITKTLSQEIKLKKKKIHETELFNELFRRYSDNLKENSLTPYAENDIFRNALLEYGTNAYVKTDEKIKKEVNRIVANLMKKSGYSEKGALYIMLQVIDKKLHLKFDDFKPY